MAEPQRSVLTGEDYLAWEEQQPDKHEFVAGEIFAMGGASDRHVTICLNIASALRAQLRGGPCRVYIADMRLSVATADAWFYPDVMVVCDPEDQARPLFKTAPVLIVEVLSPSTEAFDRGAKFAAYRSLPSLVEYLLVDPDSGRVERYRRDAGDSWVLVAADHGEAVELASVKLQLDQATIFEDAWPDAKQPS